MKIKFLLDENVAPRTKAALLRLNPMIDVLRVGDAGAPPSGTLDPEVLQFLEFSQRMLITFNRASMPAHLEAHWAAGGHIWGLFWVRAETAVGRLTEELQMFWEASEAEEWVDRIGWLPF